MLVQIKQKKKLQVLTLPGYVLHFLTALHFAVLHISTRILYNLFICFYMIVFFVIDLFSNVLVQTFDYFRHVPTNLSISLC